MRFLFVVLLSLLINHSLSLAAAIESHSRIVVMNFGTLNNSKIIGLNLEETEKALYDHIVQGLSENKNFELIELPEEKLKSENINTVGIINPKDVKRIGEIVKVRYIVYGKLLNITADETDVKILDNGLTIHAVKAQIVIRMVDVNNGNVIGSAIGSGQSKSSLVKAGIDSIGIISIGTKTVTQDSVTQSLIKAANQATNSLISTIYKNK